ncbi:unnamed protein product, partial [Ectocarpus fasciculatus]
RRQQRAVGGHPRGRAPVPAGVQDHPGQVPAVARGERAADGGVPGHHIPRVRAQLADAGGRRPEHDPGLGARAPAGRPGEILGREEG